jgi:pilus assembly protein CpaF
VGPDGKVLGRFRASGVRPSFAKKLKVMGVEMPPGLFERES